MISIHTLLIGQPQTIEDERGRWRSAIFRTPVAEPVELALHGLAGDQVADTKNHGSPDQAVCCYSLDHYSYWNRVYDLTTADAMLGPGSVGENWTLSQAAEHDLCLGDIFKVGEARVQVSGPRFPCRKPERKLKLPGFHRRTAETLRTGFYLRVLSPGMVQAGDDWTLAERPCPDLTVQRMNQCAHQAFDAGFARQVLAVPALASTWRYIFDLKLAGERP